MEKPTQTRKNLVCIVDDDEQVNKAICAIFRTRTDECLSFPSAEAFLTWFREDGAKCDLIISDINMPGASGYDLCRQVRATPLTERVPIILITGSDPNNEKSAGIECGADDFIQKPFQRRELFAKVDSLLEIRAADLQKAEQLGRMKAYFSPTVARMLTSDAPQGMLRPHRKDVTVLFIDLRRFTSFAEKVEPEEVLEVLGRYYAVVGNVVLRHNGTIGQLAGDGIMVFFNDPEPIEKHQEVAVRAAAEIREALAAERKIWAERAYDIDFGIGIAEGYATIGSIGFDRFWQYSVIGPVTNLASRLCQAADQGQILVSQKFLGRLSPSFCQAAPIGAVPLKGIEQTIAVFNVVSLGERASDLPPSCI
jgi:class 3 adenylate cyclase